MRYSRDVVTKHTHPQHASLHGRWLREQIKIAKKKASIMTASDADHKGALVRLTHLHGELAKLRPHKGGKSSSGRKAKKKK